jgi:hypothetical protein
MRSLRMGGWSVQAAGMVDAKDVPLNWKKTDARVMPQARDSRPGS